MGCSKSFKELLHIRNAADPWMCVVLSMDNRVKGWCAEDEPCSSSSSSTKKQTAQTLPVYESNHSANNLAGSICGPIQMLLPLLTKDNIEQITLHV
ncbi:unnamed protein product [Sphagnum jensenii]